MSDVRYAVWLDLTPPIAAFYAARMRELRDRFGSPVFPPHLTLTSGLRDDEAIIRQRFDAACGSALSITLDPQPARLQGEFFQAAVIPVAAPLDLSLLRRRVRADGGLDPDAAWHPHLSLLYGEYDELTKRAITSACALIDWPAIKLGGCSLWRLDGPIVDNWRPLASISWT